MKILQITAFSGWGCTGRIALGIHRAAEQKGYQGKIAWGRINTAPSDVPTLQIGTPVDYRFHALYTRLTDRCGFGSEKPTKRLIQELKKDPPELVQLHILHGYYVNLELLFSFLKELDVPVVWTFHDCWAFTGHCPYFSHPLCERYRTGCHDCPRKHHHPESWFFDRSRENWERKRALFTALQKLTIVTPSEWMAGLVRQSFLKDKPVRVIPNGISLESFHPVSSNIKERLGLAGKHLLLGVSSTWAENKGLSDLAALAEQLPGDYQILLVGLTKKQSDTLPKGLMGLLRTDSVQELAELYTAADVFLNPTWEDNYPTTNLEAIACGTPVITYRTGGSVEAVEKSGFGKIVEQGDIAGLRAAVLELTQSGEKPRHKESSGLILDERELYRQYVELYERLLSAGVSD